MVVVVVLVVLVVVVLVVVVLVVVVLVVLDDAEVVAPVSGDEQAATISARVMRAGAYREIAVERSDGGTFRQQAAAIQR